MNEWKQMQKLCLDTKVIMKPSEITSDLDKFLMETIRTNRQYLNSAEHGCIAKVNKIIDHTNIVSSVTSNIVYTVKIEVERLLPIQGLKLLVEIKMLLSTGILCQLYDIKFWIPATKTGGYKYIHNKYVKKDSELQQGDEVQIQILEIRYEKKTFSCIALLTT